jgi:fatty-acyl-CoA synthase
MGTNTATAWEAIADAVPDAVALVHGARRVTWAGLDERASRLAAVFDAAGLQPGDRVGIDLYNGNEWTEALFGALKARLVPVSINYRYVEHELADLLRYADVRALVHHASMAERVAAVLDDVGGVEVVLCVADGSEARPHARAVDYEAALAAHAPAPRRVRSSSDHLMACTGGTTGLPRGVLYPADADQQATSLTRLQLLAHLDHPEEVPAEPAARARHLVERGEQVVAVPCSPLMHITAVSAALHPALHSGGCLVTLPGRSFDAPELLRTVERERVTSLAIVGDAFARPIADALDEAVAAGRPHRLDSLRVLSSAGLMLSAAVKARLLAHLPQLTIVDSCGSAEGAHYGTSVTRRGDSTSSTRFTAAPGLLVLDEGGVPFPAGAEQRGLLASRVGTDGYHADAAKTAQVYRTIGAQRYVVPGDYGMLHPDGTVTLLGRGTSVVNTGGEKVHPEEVEDVIRAQPEVRDCVVLGTADDRMGQRVSAVLSLRPGQAVSEEDLEQRCRAALAAYKVPRRWRVVDVVPRLPNGKPDFAAARALFEGAGA